MLVQLILSECWAWVSPSCCPPCPIINPLHIVWQYIVMLISCVFQNIVEISLSHFFWTISHDIYLISTHTESPYRWLKMPIGEAIFRWKRHKKSKYTPHKWSLTGKYRFPKKTIIYALFLPIVTSRRNALLEKNAHFDHICACKILCISCDYRFGKNYLLSCGHTNDLMCWGRGIMGKGRWVGFGRSLGRGFCDHTITFHGLSFPPTDTCS